MSLPRSFAFLLLGLATANAQQPAEAPGNPAPPPSVPVAPPGVPVPGVIPPRPAGAPGANQGNKAPTNLGDTPIIEDINEPKLTGNALAGLYRRYTGRRVIVSAAAAAAEFSFVQEATPQDPLTFAKAAELLRKAAIIENFVFVPDGQDKNLEFLTLPTGGIRPTQRGVEVYTDKGLVYSESDALPEGDAVISYVMQLNYIKPVDAQNVFTQIIGQFGAYGSIAPVANASSLIITENTSLIRKLIDLKKEIDKPGSVQGTRFIKVQYADVTEIADTLTTLLTAQQTGQKTAGIQRADAAPAPGAPQIAGQAGSSGSGEETPVQIVPDPRTNRIFAMGRPVDLLFVEGLVREFDVETSEKNFLRRKLRFLTVSDFLPIAGDALNRAFSSGDKAGGAASAQGGGAARGGAQGGGAAAGGRTQSAGRQSSASSGSSGTSAGSGSSFGGSGSSSGGGGGGTGNALSDPETNSAPESVLVGRTLLVADNITNSIVVQGPPSGLEIIERLLDQIDVKPDQVMISTVIGQLSLSDSNQFGVDYLYRGNDFRAGGGGGNGVIKDLITPVAGAAAAGRFPRFDPRSLTGSGLRALGTIGDLQVYLKALENKTDFTVLSRPSIFTSNNQKGTISSGEKIAIPTGSNTYGGGTGSNTSTNIEYQDVVLKLEVIPLVNSDNEITMKIALLNDEQNGTQTIEGGAGNGQPLTVPKISTREILTTATVPNGQTIALGGLIIGRKGTDRSGIPILSNIPYLGRLFSTTTDTDTRSELLVFIQPSVVKNDRSLDAVQSDIDARYKVSSRAHEMADGPGVLPDVGAIQPVADKESGHQSSRVQPAQTSNPEPAASTMKPSIRPAHRH
ncbi:MAG: secretin N-terminal domain-containing protein [Luteolibacter sp.]|uniref:secretin N-terminal domain-containing protein n=1 Tax=Luteolibacter sp. TaxID=1962973 RepID=UPI003263573F